MKPADLLGRKVIPFVIEGGIEGLIQQYTEGTVAIQEKSEIFHCFTEGIWRLMAYAVQWAQRLIVQCAKRQALTFWEQ